MLPHAAPSATGRKLLLVDGLDEGTDVPAGSDVLTRLTFLLSGATLDVSHPLKAYLTNSHQVIATARLSSVYGSTAWASLLRLVADKRLSIFYLLPLDPREAGERLVQRIYPRWQLTRLPGAQTRKRSAARMLLGEVPAFTRPLLASYLPLFTEPLYRLDADALRATEGVAASDFPASFWKLLDDAEGTYLSQEGLDNWIAKYVHGTQHAAADLVVEKMRAEIDLTNTAQQSTRASVAQRVYTLRKAFAFDTTRLRKYGAASLMDVVAQRWIEREANKFALEPAHLRNRLCEIAINIAAAPDRGRKPRLRLDTTRGLLRDLADYGYSSLVTPVYSGSAVTSSGLTFSHRMVYEYFLADWLEAHDLFELVRTNNVHLLHRVC